MTAPEPVTPGTPVPNGKGPGWASRLIAVIPGLKNAFQVVGLLIVALAIVAAQWIPRATLAGVIAGGGIGVLLFIFGLLLPTIQKYPEDQRAPLTLKLFFGFAVVIVILFVLALFFGVAPTQAV